jgi:formate hydrogenlyase subunit 4
MFLERAGATAFLNPGLLLIAIPLFIVLIVETSRVPVDNPETHLELTMVHEAMILEYSGGDLALMELSHAIKQTLYMAVLINILLPWGLTSELSIVGILIAVAAFALKAGLLSFVTGLAESSMAKMRFFNLPSLFMIAFFFSILTIWLEVFG